jgi:hypothetical protein
MRGNPTTKTLPQILQAHFLALQHETAMTGASFAQKVREHFETTIPEHSRTIEFSRVNDISLRMQRDYEKLKRWMEDDVSHFPAQVIDSFIAAFPEDRRFKLQMELAARQGMMVIPMPSGNLSDDGVFLGRIAKETGEAIIAISQMFDGGSMKASEKSRTEAIREIDEAISVLAAMKAIIANKALGWIFSTFHMPEKAEKLEQ